MQIDLAVTNTLLGIMALASLLQVIAVVGAALAGFLVYRRLTQAIARIGARDVAPTAARVNAILDDVKTTTDAVNRGAARLARLGGSAWILSEVLRRCRRRAARSSR